MRQLTATSSPHIRSHWLSSSIMRDVILALLPAAILGIWFQGIRALMVLGLCVVSCGVTESFLTKRAGLNGAELLTGLLLGMSLPASVAWWIPVTGGVFSVLVVKHLCGGLGKNVFNPVLATRAFLLLLWPLQMTQFPERELDGLTSSTPLHAFQIPALPDASLGELLWGDISGCIGETPKIALLLGGIWLLWKGVIRPQIPLTYLGTVAVLTLIFSQGQSPILWMSYQLFSGSLILGAFFMATDYVTSPVTATGRMVYGVGCGILTVILRYHGLYPEGVTYAILCMNPLAWALDRWLAPRVFGHPSRWKRNKEPGKGANHG